jgi:MFS family permease
MAAVSPLVGTWTVRFGARRVLIASIGLLAASFLGLSRMQTAWEFYVLVSLVGVALTGVGDVTVGHTVSQWVVRGRGLALGLVFIGSNLGGILLVPLAVSIASRTSWRQALAALAAAALGVMLPIAWLLVRDPSRKEAPRFTAGEEVPGADARPGKRERREARRAEVPDAADMDVWQALRTRSFWLLFASLFTFFFYFLAMLDHLVLFLTDEGMPRPDAVWMYTFAIGLGIPSKLVLGLVADRVPEKQALLIDYAGLAASSLLLLALPHDGLIWLFVVSFGFSYAARDVVYPLIVTRCFGLTYMAQIYGALMVTLVLGAAGAGFAAAVHDGLDSYSLAFRVFAGLNLLSVAALCFVRDVRRALRR